MSCFRTLPQLNRHSLLLALSLRSLTKQEKNSSSAWLSFTALHCTAILVRAAMTKGCGQGFTLKEVSVYPDLKKKVLTSSTHSSFESFEKMNPESQAKLSSWRVYQPGLCTLLVTFMVPAWQVPNSPSELCWCLWKKSSCAKWTPSAALVSHSVNLWRTFKDRIKTNLFLLTNKIIVNCTIWLSKDTQN